jgi:hypothetical protein
MYNFEEEKYICKKHVHKRVSRNIIKDFKFYYTLHVGNIPKSDKSDIVAIQSVNGP